MIEEIEIRVNNPHAVELFRSGEYRFVSSGPSGVSLVKVRADDPRLRELASRRSEERMKREGHGYVYGTWQFVRSYSSSELAAASLLVIQFETYVPRFSEDYGTSYESSTACPLCKSGDQQVSALRVPYPPGPRRASLASTLTDELMVAEELAKALIGADLRGFALLPILPPLRKGEPAEMKELADRIAALLASYSARGALDRHLWNACMRFFEVSVRKKLKGGDRAWFQLLPLHPGPQIVAPTLYGADFASPDTLGAEACLLGDNLGEARLSELTVDRALPEGCDFSLSSQYAGTRTVGYRPFRELLVSHDAWAILRMVAKRDFVVERVHVAAPQLL